MGTLTCTQSFVRLSQSAMSKQVVSHLLAIDYFCITRKTVLCWVSRTEDTWISSLKILLTNCFQKQLTEAELDYFSRQNIMLFLFVSRLFLHDSVISRDLKVWFYDFAHKWWNNKLCACQKGSKFIFIYRENKILIFLRLELDTYLAG